MPHLLGLRSEPSSDGPLRNPGRARKPATASFQLPWQRLNYGINEADQSLQSGSHIWIRQKKGASYKKSFIFSPAGRAKLSRLASGAQKWHQRRMKKIGPKQTIFIVLVFGAVAWLLVPQPSQTLEGFVPQHELLFLHSQSAAGAHVPADSRFAPAGDPGNGWKQQAPNRMEFFGTYQIPGSQADQHWRVQMNKEGGQWAVVSVEVSAPSDARGSER
jgi:hypothetical protein